MGIPANCLVAESRHQVWNRLLIRHLCLRGVSCLLESVAELSNRFFVVDEILISQSNEWI